MPPSESEGEKKGRKEPQAAQIQRYSDDGDDSVGSSGGLLPIAAYRRPETHALHNEALLLYLEMGEGRTVRKVAEQMLERHGDSAPTETTLLAWSGRDRWRKFAARHDSEIAEQERQQLIKQEVKKRAALREKRLKVAEDAREKGYEALLTMDPARLAQQPMAVVKLLQFAFDTERIDLGEATSRTESIEVLSADVERFKEDIYAAVNRLSPEARAEFIAELQQIQLARQGVIAPVPINDVSLDGGEPDAATSDGPEIVTIES